MKKQAHLLMVIALVFALTGCGSKAKQQEKPVEPEKALAENATSITMDSLNTTNLTSPQSQPMASVSTGTPVEEAQMLNVRENFTTKDVQQALQNANIYSGSVDGVLGPKTKRAIRTFQEQNNLSADGKVGPKTWRKLKAYLNKLPDTVTPEAIN